jgi:SAM-dependent methyltransferase
MNSNAELRKRQEISHGARIAENAEKVWQRDTASGQKRMQNRFEDLEHFFSVRPGNTLLEIGCGTGTWTRYLTKLPAQIHAMDISEDLLAMARTKMSKPDVQFVCGDIEKLPFADQSFDFVCGLSILHHLDNPKALSEIYRVLKKGGKVWFSEPNMLNPQIMIQKNVLPIKRWLGDTPDETAFFRWPLQRDFESTGFKAVWIKPFDFLHPQIPSALTSLMDRLGKQLERVPFLKEIGGSLLIHAEK